MTCPQCSAEISDRAKFCPECGTAISSVRSAAAAERRQLTVMFCDVVSSTSLSTEIDPEELRDVMRHYQEACAKVIERFEGKIWKYLGDGLLVQFGYPRAHEDDAQRAVRAGLGMIDAIRFSDFHLASGRKVPLHIRIGIHSGEVLIDQIGSEAQRQTDIVGETPNIAARMQALAEPDTLVISESTQVLVAGFFETESLGIQRVKGIAEPMEVFRVQHESAARTRFEASRHAGISELVGRNDEMARLETMWEDARNGHGHTVYVSGEAGIGKSRIALALKEYVAGQPNAWLVETQCSPYYQNTAFYPIAQLFERTVLQFVASDDPASRIAKLEGYFIQNGIDLAQNVPLMLPLFSLPPSEKYPPLDALSTLTKQRTMDLLLRLLLQRAAQQPVLFIAEDMHWADPSTLDLLGQVLPRVPESHILTVLTYRPEFTPPWDVVSEHITLAHLREEDTRSMIQSLVRQKQLPQEIAEQILTKTDGVPLFIEELTRTIVESDALVEHEDRYEMSGSIKSTSVPATLKDSLMARLDRLPSAKRVAQVASVLGREFTFPLLQAIYPDSKSNLQTQLSELVASGLVFETAQGGDPQFIFKHALVQDAAYDSLLKTERQNFHLATATALREIFPDLYTQQPELVAQHYTAANRIEAAIPEWLRAGKQADGRSANQEAGTHYRKGMELLSQLPPDSLVRGYELPLQLSYGMSLLMVKGYSVPEVATALTRARELIQYIGDAAELPMILWALWAYYVTVGDLNISIQYATEFLEVAKRRSDESLLVEANSMFVLERLLSGNFLAAHEEMEACIARYSVAKFGKLAYQFTQDPLVVTAVLGSWNEYILGYPDRARKIAAMMLDHARTLGHNFSLNYGVAFAAWLYFFMDMPDETEALAAEALQIAQANGYALWMGDALILLGWVQHCRGNHEQGFGLFEQGLGIFRMVGRGAGLPGILDIRVELLLSLGRYDEARATLDERWELEARTNQPFQHSRALLLEAELLLANSREASTGPGAAALAEDLLRQSIQDAKQRSARSFELRSQLRLLELVRGTEREAEALRELRELYDTFTEGFDAPLFRRAASVLGVESLQTA